MGESPSEKVHGRRSVREGKSKKVRKNGMSSEEGQLGRAVAGEK